jgi:hypothetical protein
MRDKLLFTEAMVASGELTGRELRVGILLISLWSPNRGFAHPSIQFIADALNIDERDAGKALKALEAKGRDRETDGRSPEWVRVRPSSTRPPPALGCRPSKDRFHNVRRQAGEREQPADNAGERTGELVRAADRLGLCAIAIVSRLQALRVL